MQQTGAEALHERVRDTRLLLLVLGQRLARQQQQAADRARKRRGLAQLRASAAPTDATEAAHYEKWFAGLSLNLELDDPNPAANTTTRWLLAARVTGLRAEVAALTAGNSQGQRQDHLRPVGIYPLKQLSYVAQTLGVRWQLGS